MEQLYKCPECGDNHVHIEKIEVNNTEKPVNVEVVDNQHLIVKPDRMKGCEDYFVTLRFFCEEGHRFKIVYHHHEGLMTYET